MNSIFAPPRGWGAARLGLVAALSFVLAAFTLGAALDPEAGVPSEAALARAYGRIAHVSAERYGVKFRLQGRAEIFDYPSSAGGSDHVEAALLAAGNRGLALLFDPVPRRPWFGSGPYYDVWQLAVDGKTIRSVAESKQGWRANNRVTPWLCAWFFLSGVYFSVSAVRARRLQAFR